MMKKRQRSGVINLSSLTGRFAYPYYQVYSATKVRIILKQRHLMIILQDPYKLKLKMLIFYHLDLGLFKQLWSKIKLISLQFQHNNVLKQLCIYFSNIRL